MPLSHNDAADMQVAEHALWDMASAPSSQEVCADKHETLREDLQFQNGFFVGYRDAFFLR